MVAGRVFNLFSHYYSISPVVTLPHSSPIRPSVSEEDAPQGHLVVSLVVVPEPMVSHVVVSHTLGMPLLTNIAVFQKVIHHVVCYLVSFPNPLSSGQAGTLLPNR